MYFAYAQKTSDTCDAVDFFVVRRATCVKSMLAVHLPPVTIRIAELSQRMSEYPRVQYDQVTDQETTRMGNFEIIDVWVSA